LAVDGCFVDHPTLFTAAYRSSEGFNSAELENPYIAGHPLRHQFQHVYIYGPKIIYRNKHGFDKLNDTDIYRVGVLDGFQRTDYVKASFWHRCFFYRLDVYYCERKPVKPYFRPFRQRRHLDYFCWNKLGSIFRIAKKMSHGVQSPKLSYNDHNNRCIFYLPFLYL
jgi:hypothetical protein